MRKIHYKKTRKVNPGLLEYTGLHHKVVPDLQLFVYNAELLTEITHVVPEKLDAILHQPTQKWLNLHGLTDVELVKVIGEKVGMDTFLLTDVMNTTRRPKLEEYHDALFFSIKSILPHENSECMEVEQISFFLKDGLLVSFQEKKSDFFTHIRERLRTHAGLVRDKKTDYLLYLLLDAVMENFYITIETEENHVEELINLAKTNGSPRVLELVELHRDHFHLLKRSILPLRDSLYSLKTLGEEHPHIGVDRQTFCFFDRLHQKSLELLDQIDYDMQTLEGVGNFYFSTQSHKMNEVMKTLTVVSVFFMPLTFVVGIYGMNFDNMPELHWVNGYYIVMFGMGLLLALMFWYFKRKRWF
ncbi:MAG: magnesium and cobalt transport protein CorA [Flavobacterium sp. BFFFF2]|nr:MAG: magnesium and cobalt transport protein CorA [Flavobacterium sp. BFFFF2]